MIAGGDFVTLVTCTPYAVNSHRLLVRGVRVPTVQAAPEAAAPAPTGTGWTIESWMWPRLAGAALAVLLALTMLVTSFVTERRLRRRRALAAAAAARAPAPVDDPHDRPTT